MTDDLSCNLQLILTQIKLQSKWFTFRHEYATIYWFEVKIISDIVSLLDSNRIQCTRDNSFELTLG